MRHLFVALILLLPIPAYAQFGVPKIGGAKYTSFADVGTLDIKVTPTTARRGEVVTVVLTVTPKKDCWTYPVNTKQTGKNDIMMPPAGDLIFVGDITDPADPELKFGSTDLIYKKPVTWELKAVVSPQATPGKKTVKLLGTRIQVCYSESCFYQNSPSFEIEISDEAPVTVPAQYQEAVNQALKSVAPTQNPPSPNPNQKTTDATGQKRIAQPFAEYEEDLANLEKKIQFIDQSSMISANSSIFKLLAIAAFWGLISLVTPCVFPMIPITVSLFLKKSQDSTANVLKMAIVYCLTIIIVLGISAVSLLSVFREWSVSWGMNIFMGGLFFFFALSLFGMYNIMLPNFLLRGAEAGKQRGGLIGTIFSAVAFTIVSFTCVAPFLGGFSGLIASGNYSYLELMLAGLTFSTAFASPFFLLALFPRLLKALPKSGGWLETVKIVMGFLELAAAFKFFRTAEIRLLPSASIFSYDTVLAAWIAISVTCGFYLLGLFRLPHDDEQQRIAVPRLLFAMLFLGFGAYLAPAMFQDHQGKRLRPTGEVYAWVDAFLLPDPANAEEIEYSLPHTVKRMQEAIRAGEPMAKQLIFTDFTGVTCTNCRYNENNIFTIPEVKELLDQFVVVQIYTDELPATAYEVPPTDLDRKLEGEANLEFQKRVFKDERLPLYSVLRPRADGKVDVIGVYPESKINDVKAFTEFLRKQLQSIEKSS